MILSLHNGDTIHTEDQAFASGAEGDLYRIVSPGNYTGLVLKLYKPEKRTTEREQKIKYLMENPPDLPPDDTHQSIIWVRHVAYLNRGAFAGFTMPLAKGEKLEVLSSLRLSNLLSTAWHRFDLTKPGSLELRMKVCFNLAVAIHHIHTEGRYVLADMKPENVMISPNGLISIVDTDSVEVVEDGVMLYQPPVATPEFTPPEFYGGVKPGEQLIEPSWDYFSMAIIFYKLLLGIHPFSANNHKPPYQQYSTLAEMIEHGLFAHGSKRPYMGIIPPPHNAFNALPAEIKSLFMRCFEEGHSIYHLRPSAEEWCKALARATGAAIPSNAHVKFFHCKADKEFPASLLEIQWKTEGALWVHIKGIGFVPQEGTYRISRDDKEEHILTLYDTTGSMVSKHLAPPIEEPIKPKPEAVKFKIAAFRRFFMSLIVVLPIALIAATFVYRNVELLGMEILALLVVIGIVNAGRRFFFRAFYHSPLYRSRQGMELHKADLNAAYKVLIEKLNTQLNSIEYINIAAKAELDNTYVAIQQMEENKTIALRQPTLQKKRSTEQNKIKRLSKAMELIAQKEKKATELLLQDQQTMARQRELQRYVILFQNINGLTRADKDTLLFNGFRTAGDILDVNANTGDIKGINGKWVHLAGIGKVKGIALYDWFKQACASVEKLIPKHLTQMELEEIQRPNQKEKEGIRRQMAEINIVDNELRMKILEKQQDIKLKFEKERAILLDKLQEFFKSNDYDTQITPVREEYENICIEIGRLKENMAELEIQLLQYRQVTLKHYLVQHFVG